MDIENVTDSWVDRHSLLQKEMQAALNQEREKLESPTGNPLVAFPQVGTKKEMPKYMRSMNPLKWMSKIFKTGSEKQKFLNKKKEKQVKREKDTGSVSARNYPLKNEIRYNSYSYRFEKKSIFSMPHLGFFAEKYKLKSKGEKGKLRGSFAKRKTKNFVKKNKEFKDEICGKEEKKRMKEELVKGKRKEKIKAVQSMCTSAIQNITDSNILIVKTRSGQEIKTKKCLDEVKQILEEFRKDLKTKQSRMRENNEDIQELRSSVKRLESDIKEAQRVPGRGVDTREKEAEVAAKTKQILDLENTNSTLSKEIESLTNRIEELKRENENNLKEVKKVVRRKFREIESRNKHERQVQKDIILKYNVELESKNSEINELIGRYQELRLLNEDLSREIGQVKRGKKRSKSSVGDAKSRANLQAKLRIQKKKSRSKLAEEQLARRVNISENAILKMAASFEEALEEMQKKLQEEGERLEELAKAKEESKKKLYNLEKLHKKKAKELQQSRGRMDLKNQLVQLEVSKSNKARSLETKHRMLKTRRELLGELVEKAEKVESLGKRVVGGTMEQLRTILQAKDELRKKESVVEDQLKREKYLTRVNEMKEQKIKGKNAAIEKLTMKIGELEGKVAQSRKFKIVRDKSGHSKKDFSLKKKNHSTNNLEGGGKKKRLYHNTNKTGSHTNFYNINNKFMSETLNSIKSGKKAKQEEGRKVGKSSTISRRKKKSKVPSREELSEKYAIRIKNNYKNILNEMKTQKKEKSKRESKLRKKKREGLAEEKLEKVEAELNELRSKYSLLEKKYVDTHNDLLRSTNSVRVEALRYKKKSERNLQNSLRAINEKASGFQR